jgi:type IV secretion system protein VirD4
MSSRTTPSTDARRWGPSHQHLPPPFSRKPSLIGSLAGLVAVLALLSLVRALIDPTGAGLIDWTLGGVLIVLGARALLMLAVAATTRTPRSPLRPPASGQDIASAAPPAPACAQAVPAGAYLGRDADGDRVHADPQSAVMVLGPPRSGKTSAVMIPALAACAGPAVSTSTKPDVLGATLAARSRLGQAWLYDPSGDQPCLPRGVRRLGWSPIAGAESWDQALLLARAMTAAGRVGVGTTNEGHWAERASALLAPLLYAAHLSERPVEEVLRWVLRHDLAPALSVLDDHDAHIALDVLGGIERTESRERSSIFSAGAGTLSAYNSDAARASAARPNFDPVRFVQSTDTVYVTAPEHRQALCAPLIVGLLEQIRHAVYDHDREANPQGPPMLWLLDELANTAPIHDLPALISQAGGQGLQVVVGLQDLSQARLRWGQDAADGLLSLFQTRLVLSGIADARTLESISMALGEYDRGHVSQALGHSEPQEWFPTTTHSNTISYQTQRQRVLGPGEIARLPDKHALLLQRGDWRLLRLIPWHERGPRGAETSP